MEEPGYVTSLEYLARGPLGAAALEASYYEGPEHVEEASECFFTNETSNKAAAWAVERI